MSIVFGNLVLNLTATDMTIGTIHTHLCNILNTPVEHQRLYYRGQHLVCREMTLDDYFSTLKRKKKKDDDFIHLTLSGLSGGGPGVSKEAVISLTNSLVAESTLVVENDCIVSTLSSQNIILGCNPMLNNKRYEDNSTCLACLNDITQAWQTQLYQETRMWNAGNLPSVRINFDTEFRDIMQQQEACKVVCKACSFSNNSQKSTINVQASCTFDETVVIKVQAQITASLMGQLNTYTDVLSAFAQTIGAKQSQELEAVLSNIVRTTFNGDILNQMISVIENNQTLIYKNFQTASDVSGNSQESGITAMVTYLADNGIANNMLSTAQWDLMFQIYTDNTTIDDIGTTVFKSIDAIVSVVDTVLGYILLGTIVFLGAVLVAIIILYIVRKMKTK
jgi:hypothetical protein